MNEYPFAQQVRKQLEDAEVFWLYQGIPRRNAPHALLTSGKHSDGFANVGQALKERLELREEFARYILAVLRQVGYKSSNLVVGADTSSTDLAGNIAIFTGGGHIRMVKTEDKRGKRQVWHSGNAPLWGGETILHIEELITTSSSALLVREGIRHANPGMEVKFAPFLPVVVERSDPDNRVIQVEESMILPLLQLSIRNYEPNSDACPYCAVGSEAIKPKEGDNWTRLTDAQ